MQYSTAPVLIITLFMACACSQQQPLDLPSADDALACPKARPEICTMNYDPVCATHKDGRLSTQPNNCSACSDADIVSYRFGACK